MKKENRGGSRSNAGRKAEFDQPTVLRQIPVAWLEAFAKWKKRMSKKNG